MIVQGADFSTNGFKENSYFVNLLTEYENAGVSYYDINNTYFGIANADKSGYAGKVINQIRLRCMTAGTLKIYKTSNLDGSIITPTLITTANLTVGINTINFADTKIESDEYLVFGDSNDTAAIARVSSAYTEESYYIYCCRSSRTPESAISQLAIDVNYIV